MHLNTCNFNVKNYQALNREFSNTKLTNSYNSSFLRTGKTDSIDFNKSACTDGADDGKISLSEETKSFLKGVISPITSMFSSPKNFLIGAGTMAVGAALIAATGGAAAPLLVAAGVVGGGIQFTKSAIEATNATTDAEAKEAWEGIGSGTSAVAMSVVGAKSALKASNVAGGMSEIEAANAVKGMNVFKATAKCFTSAPKSLSNSISAFTEGKALSNLASIFKAKKGKTTANERVEESAQKALNESVEKPAQEVLNKSQASSESKITDIKQNMAEIKPETKAEVNIEDVKTEPPIAETKSSVIEKPQQAEQTTKKPTSMDDYMKKIRQEMRRNNPKADANADKIISHDDFCALFEKAGFEKNTNGEYICGDIMLDEDALIDMRRLATQNNGKHFERITSNLQEYAEFYERIGNKTVALFSEFDEFDTGTWNAMLENYGKEVPESAAYAINEYVHGDYHAINSSFDQNTGNTGYGVAKELADFLKTQKTQSQSTLGRGGSLSDISDIKLEDGTTLMDVLSEYLDFTRSKEYITGIKDGYTEERINILLDKLCNEHNLSIDKKGVLSTSPGKTISAWSGSPTQWKISAPEGTHGVFVQGTKNVVPKEIEFLVLNNTSNIESVKFITDPSTGMQLHIKANMVTQ